jgi:hypothetical protein
LVIATIHDHSPHILGVREALHGQLDALDGALPAHRELGVGRDDGRVEASGIDRREFGALWPSDHFPVWAVLGVKAR